MPDAIEARSVAVIRAVPSTPDLALIEGLPRRGCLELPAGDEAPGAARRWLAQRLREWSLAEFQDVSWLVATELMSNAVAATGAVHWALGPPALRLWLRAGPKRIALLAWDPTLTAPVPRQAGRDDENGRGLAIVARLSREWGFYYPARETGKITWAVIESP
ncbi:MAG TPA: ATP-binding protein [Trebonia sp.]|nr:ATP-binding protein [Trebonia sp.]